MNLIQKVDRKEGEPYSREVYIAFGKSILSDGTFDGWYLQIVSPFVQNRQYVDPNTFTVFKGDCRKVRMFRYRPGNRLGRKHLFLTVSALRPETQYESGNYSPPSKV